MSISETWFLICPSKVRFTALNFFIIIFYELQQNVLKLADFGSCRSVYSKPPHTEYISTRWYRAPECLLTDGYYSLKMDIWSAGCVFFEIMRCFPRSFTCFTFTSAKSQHTVEFKRWDLFTCICIQLCVIWLFMCIHIHKQMYGNTYVNLSYYCTPARSSLNPLFPGATELDQVAKIHNVLGTPDQSTLQKLKQ